MRVVFISWRDLAHPQAGGSDYVNDRLATGLENRGHEVALLAGTPVADHGYEVVDTGGRYTQYLRAPLEHRRRFRGWDVVVDVETASRSSARCGGVGPACASCTACTSTVADVLPRAGRMDGHAARDADHAGGVPAPALRARCRARLPSRWPGSASIRLGSARSRWAAIRWVTVDRSPTPLFRGARTSGPAQGSRAARRPVGAGATGGGGRLVVAGDGPEARPSPAGRRPDGGFRARSR